MDYEKLYQTCYMQIYSYVMTLCGNRDLAEEITEETFFRAISAGETKKFSGLSEETTWLCAIAKNLFFDEMRKRKRVTELPDDTVSGDDIEGKIEDEDLSLRIHRALHSLPEPYKEIFSLRVFGELSFEKIGELFGKNETWARVTYHRARLKIREKTGLN